MSTLRGLQARWNWYGWLMGSGWIASSGVLGDVGVDLPDEAGVVRVGRAVRLHLRRIDDDVVVAACDDVDPGRPLHHGLVLVQPEVAQDDDDVDVGANEIDVELRRLLGLQREDAEAVRLVEDRPEAREVAHPDDADLEPALVEDGERLEDGADEGAVGDVGVAKLVVRGKYGEIRPLLELTGDVERALVELVVADDHRVHADRGGRPNLRLTEEVVEDGGPFEEVARVQVEHSVGPGSLATEDIGEGGHPADVRDRVVLPEA